MRLLRLVQDANEMWSLLPDSDRTTEMASIAFRMSSEAGSLVEKLLAGPHDRPPFQTFLLIENTSSLQRFRNC